MRFIDPLAALQHMGGAPPVHFAMALYALCIKLYNVDKIECF